MSKIRDFFKGCIDFWRKDCKKIGNYTFTNSANGFISIRNRGHANEKLSSFDVNLLKIDSTSVVSSLDDLSDSVLEIRSSGSVIAHLSDDYVSNRRKQDYIRTLIVQSREKSRAGFSSVLMIASVLVLLLIIASGLKVLLSGKASLQASPVPDAVTGKINEPYPELQLAPRAPQPVDSEKIPAAVTAHEQNAKLIRPDSRLAALLAKGVSTGDYSLSLGNMVQNKGTIYVFSDPLCPHCRKIEPLLEKLAADYLINIFPVSVIGQDRSAPLARAVLCQEPAERTLFWKNLVSGALSSNRSSKECHVGSVALKNNNATYYAFGFMGTPTLIRQDGAAFDITREFTIENIESWMNEAAE